MAVLKAAGPHRRVNFFVARDATKNGKQRFICCYRAEVTR